MKTIYKIMLAALAAAVALASCTKEFAEQNERDPKADGIRTIGVSFAEDTRSYLSLDGVTPMFERGDSIMVSNGKRFEICKVFAADTLGRHGLWFRTALKGHLSAVYPAKCAKMNGAEITGILVPSIQSGRFKDANIAVAGIDEDSEYALFKNKTAVLKFYVDHTIGVLDIGIKETEKRMIANAYLDENGKIVEEDGLSIISVPGRRPLAKAQSSASNVKTLDEIVEDKICYVAILPTKTGESYNLDVTTHTLSKQGGGMTQKRELASLGNEKAEAIQPSEVRRTYSNVSLPAGVMANVFIPYSVDLSIGIDENDNDIIMKWGYCNVGAFLPEEPGKYFAWGEVEGWKFDENEVEFEDSHDFCWENYRLNGGYEEFNSSYFAGVENDVYKKGMLVPNCDAATDVWGDGWRLPTKFEVEQFFRGLDFQLNDEYRVVMARAMFLQQNSNFLAIPYSGIGVGKEIDEPKNIYFWTSTLNADKKEEAYMFSYLNDTDTKAHPGPVSASQSVERCYGAPIRPIYGEPFIDGTGMAVEEFEEGGTLY